MEIALLAIHGFTRSQSGRDLTFIDLNPLFQGLPVTKSNPSSFGAHSSRPDEAWLK